MLLAGIGILLIATVARFGPVGGLVSGVTVLAAAFAGSWYAFAEHRLLIAATDTAIAGFVLYTTLTFLNFLRGDAEKREIHRIQPVPVARAGRQLARHPELRLGGELRDMTILFGDIRGFTAISEQYKAHRRSTHGLHQRLPDAADGRGARAPGGRSTSTWATASWRSGTRPSTIPTMPIACDSALAMLATVGELNEAPRQKPIRSRAASSSRSDGIRGEFKSAASATWAPDKGSTIP